MDISQFKGDNIKIDTYIHSSEKSRYANLLYEETNAKGKIHGVPILFPRTGAFDWDESGGNA